MSSRQRVQYLAATALSGTATVLREIAKVTAGLAEALRPPRDRDGERDGERAGGLAGYGTTSEATTVRTDGVAGDDGATVEATTVRAADVAETFSERGRVKDRTQVTDVTHAEAPPTHVAEIAGGTVAQVRTAIGGLSTDELRLLHEHETSHKGRKGVLDAIEQALTP